MNIKKISVIISVLMLSFLALNGYFVGNPPCELLDPSCGGGDSKISGPSLYGLIVDAAAAFLKSNSSYQGLLNKVELTGKTGVPAEEMISAVETAIIQMELAHGLYANICQLCLDTEFNPVIVEKLKGFDYKSYQITFQPNPIIFDKVTDILKDADLPAVYQELYQYTGNILGQLKGIRESLETYPSPQLPLLWRANQTYMNAASFGQYTSEVLLSSN